MVKYVEKNLGIDQLILDPNNYRYQDEVDFFFTEEERYADPGVQRKAFAKLRDESLESLKNSITHNGFIPVEKIVVIDYPHGENLYVVVEGNRRTAALKWIQQEIDGGLDAPETLGDTLSAVPVIVLEDVEDRGIAERSALMGIRHVSGIKQWGGYQRAKLVAEMKDRLGLSPQEVAQRLGMSSHEVFRRYRAFKALEQMREDGDHGEWANPEKYPIFHEALAVPLVREWLGWDEEDASFGDYSNLAHFYDLITPTPNEDGQKDSGAKIASYQDVRELRAILQNAEAKRVLLDPNKSLWDAISISRKDELKAAWRSEIHSAIAALGNVGALELIDLSDEDIEGLENLQQSVTTLLETLVKIRA